MGIMDMRQTRHRHAELIDKKFAASLSLDEQAELLRIEADLDRAEAGFYEPIEDRLVRALNQSGRRVAKG